ncbi:MAG: sulfatase-like hydrolase/transferase [Pseudomonadales bacterium]|nr:sulfatase-like hydrolase/transferase [Pseudomonadales bacterium]
MTPIRRREFIKASGTAAAIAPFTTTAKAAANPPNIVFILADDMGYGDVSYLNPDSKIPTPNIDKIAREGTYFSDAHSPSSICTPTRYGIHTGRYCWRTRITNSVTWGYSRHLIEPHRLTVASLLKQVGYNTGCFGKWHMGMDMMTRDGAGLQAPDKEVDRRAFRADIDWNAKIENGPLDVGFDEFYGISASLDMYPYIWIDGDRFVGECTTEQDLLFNTRDAMPADHGKNMGPSHADFVAEDVQGEITNKTVEFINKQSADKPFFACMALAAPHIPIVPSKAYQGLSQLGPYGDFCIQVDDDVGRILSALEQKGVADSTLIVFTSDNGCAPYIGVDEMNRLGHYPSYLFRGYKADIYEGGNRIPFLARWPQAISPGSRSDEIICLTDLLATTAAITGRTLPQNAGEDSYNILSALLGQPSAQPIREATIAQSATGGFSVRQGRWKLELIPSSGGYYRLSPDQVKTQGLPPVQLFDLEADIKESKNIQGDHPEVVAHLTGLLNKYRREGRST